MQASRKLMLFKMCREARVEVAYQDGTYLSIAFGHNGSDVKPGDVVDEQRALALLIQDIRKRDLIVNTLLARRGLQLKQHEYDAVFDLYYQGGTDGLVGKEVNGVVRMGVLHYLEQKDLIGATKEYLEWDENAADEDSMGLFKRRVRGADMLVNGEYGELKEYPVYVSDPKPGGKGRKPDYFAPITDETLKEIP